ncbi:MAG: alanyl-tRNA editing protein [Treponema sp.]|jgi:Ser-tRNA(Ala) deacylase AlaX|nr:alanyl-tRNA editing protein [Treponema sp.]
MSIKLFWEDTYSARNDARVTSVEGDVITVDRTVAFAFPGGQVFDTGTIGGKPIVDARYDKEKLEVYYTLPRDHGLKTGDTVTVEIGWDRRYALMKLHFIAELALVVLCNHYGRHKLYRADILPEKAVLGFEWEIDIAEAFPLLETKLKELIAQDISIISNWEDKAAEKRYWEIPGLAKVPCGGTHLKKTGEIGGFSLKKTSPGSGKAEFELYLVS